MWWNLRHSRNELLLRRPLGEPYTASSSANVTGSTEQTSEDCGSRTKLGSGTASC